MPGTSCLNIALCQAIQRVDTIPCVAHNVCMTPTTDIVAYYAWVSLQFRVNRKPGRWADCFVAGHCQPKSSP